MWTGDHPLLLWTVVLGPQHASLIQTGGSLEWLCLEGAVAPMLPLPGLGQASKHIHLQEGRFRLSLLLLPPSLAEHPCMSSSAQAPTQPAKAKGGFPTRR